jgi:dienelactone hydrolase
MRAARIIACMTGRSFLRCALALAFVLTPMRSSAQTTPTSVTLTAKDGTVLKATYHAAKEPGPGLVLLHQCNRDRSSWSAFAQAAAARGYHVIALDFRGFGESGGPRFDALAGQAAASVEKWPADVDLAYEWLIARPGVDRRRIGAAGASCGVNQSVLLAQRHPEVRTVMLLSGPITQPARRYLREAPAVSVLAAASDDDGGAVDTMRWVLGWSSNPANRLVQYRAAGHGTEMFEAEKGLQPLMLDWLDAQLKNASTTAPSAAAAPAPATPVQLFWATLEEPDGAVRARKLFDATPKKDRKVLFPEGEMNAHGYELLQRGDAENAIVVFQMNVDGYPGSANTYDSLSDAYLAAGRRADALRFAEKALEMLARDTQTPEAFKAAIRESAQKKIDELKR